MCRFATMIMILALSLGNQLANAAGARMCKLVSDKVRQSV
jgi:hypothetical protein